jgi:hypothetical protein
VGGDDMPPLTRRYGQDDAGVSDLVPGQGITASDPPEHGFVARKEVQRIGPAATHWAISFAGDGDYLQQIACHEFVASFASNDTK